MGDRMTLLPVARHPHTSSEFKPLVGRASHRLPSRSIDRGAVESTPCAYPLYFWEGSMLLPRSMIVRACLACGLAVAVVAGWGLATSLAADPPTITRIEEDWELVIGDPDVNANSPQVSCVTSPLGHLNGLYAVLELNHRTQPDYIGGGLQLQVWNGPDQLVATKTGYDQQYLSYSGETIRWTQALQVSSGSLMFDVFNGTSESWGTFGPTSDLRRYVSTTLTDLNGYDPNVSVENSGVGYGGNRVTSLVLKQVRWYAGGTLVQTDNNPKTIH
jgi:hypothetical protein